MADLLAMLGSAGSMAESPHPPTRNEPKPIVSLKAGRMTTTKLANGKLEVTPELERGQIELFSGDSPNSIKFIWRNRRSKEIGQNLMIFDTDQCTFRQVYAEQRIYVLQFPSETSSDDENSQFHFYWLQDVHSESDLELTRSVAKYVQDPAGKADKKKEESPSLPSSSPTNNDSTAPNPTGDALSHILDNLASSTADTTTQTTSGAAAQLTLADLQGAMAGLATSSPTPTPPVTTAPLTEIASVEHIRASGILDDLDTKAKLIALLPPNQQDEEHLMEHLSAPQVRAALSSLTSALLMSPESFHSVIMNFQFRPEDAVSMGNPIQAFFECLMAQVEREKQEEEKSDADS